MWYLVPALPRSVGFGPVSSPPRFARTEQLSTTTSQEAAAPGPERTIPTRAAWTRRSRAVALHSSRRRRRVEPQARPAAARSSRHCPPPRGRAVGGAAGAPARRPQPPPLHARAGEEPERLHDLDGRQGRPPGPVRP